MCLGVLLLFTTWNLIETGWLLNLLSVSFLVILELKKVIVVTVLSRVSIISVHMLSSLGPLLSFLQRTILFCSHRFDIIHIAFGHFWIHFCLYSSFAGLSQIQEQISCITWFSPQHIIFRAWGLGSHHGTTIVLDDLPIALKKVAVFIPLNIPFQIMFYSIGLILFYMHLLSHCLPFSFLTLISKLCHLLIE